MNEEEWQVIFELITIGEMESPWGWSPGWPQEVDGDKTRKIVEKFERFVKEKQGDI